MKIIDLRSDTVTRPSEGMRKAMYNAEVGDDVFKEDPTVNKLEEYTAELFGKDAALFVPSGVMGNQICINILTTPGDEIICERYSHIFNYESGSPAKLSGVQLFPLEGENGILTAAQVESAIRPVEAYYMPRTKMIVIENTHNSAGGIVQPIENIIEIKSIVSKMNLYYHLDGARIWNAHVETGIPLSGYALHFHTLSCALSKGLGAPAGSVILGTIEFIQEAIRVRKSFGGGMRQAGILAAAGLYAIQNNLSMLKEDHIKAINFAGAVAENKNLFINMDNVHTNIIMFKPLNISAEEAVEKCKAEGLLLSIVKTGWLRGVTHLDVSKDDIETAKGIINKVL
jgi:threonine aldolase